MNNFFLNQDPLLNQQTYDNPTPIMFQQMPNAKDCIGELDRTLKGLSPAVLAKLSENPLFNIGFTVVISIVIMTIGVCIWNKGIKAYESAGS